jgi:hypothetical protein
MMSTMTDETYNGYKNRETWAFNLHWQNDQGLYNETLEYAKGQDPSDLSDTLLGDMVVSYWREYIAERAENDGWLPEPLGMFRDEVGSWWRVDATEVGEAVRESLDTES